MRVVLHIGTNKTGTSALQGYLLSNPPTLQEANLIYPQAGRTTPDAPAHHRLAYAVGQAPHQADYFVSELSEEAANSDADGVFLSSEVFHTVNPAPLISSFREAGHTIEVICAVRNHVDYFSSWYRQTVKSEVSTFDFPNFVNLINKPYAPFLVAWLDAVGRDNFHLYGYRDHSFMPGNNPSPLFDAITHSAQMDPNVYKKNASITGNLLLLKRVLNNFITREVSLQIIPELWEISALRKSFQGNMYVSPETCSFIDRTYARDTQYVFEYFGVDISSQTSFREGSKVPDLDTLAADRKFILSICDERSFLLGDLLTKYTGPC